MFNKKKALILILLGALLPLSACESSRACPPNEPIYKWKEVPKPYPIIIPIEEVECEPLPDYPEHPGEDATEEEMKSWALEIKRVNSERDALQEACIDAWEEMVRTHNRFKIAPDPDPVE